MPHTKTPTIRDTDSPSHGKTTAAADKYRGLDTPISHIHHFWLLAFIANLCVTTIVYLPLLMHTHYAVDSFIMYTNGLQADVQLAGSRFVNGFIAYLLGVMGINPVTHQPICYFIFFIGTAAATTILAKAFVACTPDIRLRTALIADAAMLISFVNVFYLMLVLFPETTLYSAVALPCVALAVSAFLELKGPRRYVLSFLFLLLALGSYQAYIGCFVSYVFAGAWLSYHTHHRLRRAFKDWFTCLVVTALACVADLASRKLFLAMGLIGRTVKNTTLSLSTVLNNIHLVIQYQPSIWTNANTLFPNTILPVFLIFLLVALVYALCRRCRPVEAIMCLIVLFIAYWSVFATHYVESEALYAARVNLPFWCFIAALQALVGILLVERREDGANPTNISSKIFVTVILVFFIASSVIIQNVLAENEVNTARNIDDAQAILDEIQQSEQETQVRVTTLSFCTDNDIQWYYPEAKYPLVGGDFDTRMMPQPWSRTTMLEFFSGRDFSDTDMPADVYDTYFSGKTWTSMDADEQVVVIGDTAYIDIY